MKSSHLELPGDLGLPGTFWYLSICIVSIGRVLTRGSNFVRAPTLTIFLVFKVMYCQSITIITAVASAHFPANGA